MRLLCLLRQQRVAQRRQLADELLGKGVLLLPAAAGAQADERRIHQPLLRTKGQRRRHTAWPTCTLQGCCCSRGSSAKRRLAAGRLSCLLSKAHHRRLQVGGRRRSKVTLQAHTANWAPVHGIQAPNMARMHNYTCIQAGQLTRSSASTSASNCCPAAADGLRLQRVDASAAADSGRSMACCAALHWPEFR